MRWLSGCLSCVGVAVRSFGASACSSLLAKHVCHTRAYPYHHLHTPSAEEEEDDDVHFDDHHVLVLNFEATSIEALETLDTAEIQVRTVLRWMVVGFDWC